MHSLYIDPQRASLHSAWPRLLRCSASRVASDRIEDSSCCCLPDCSTSQQHRKVGETQIRYCPRSCSSLHMPPVLSRSRSARRCLCRYSRVVGDSWTCEMDCQKGECMAASPAPTMIHYCSSLQPNPRPARSKRVLPLSVLSESSYDSGVCTFGEVVIRCPAWPLLLPLQSVAVVVDPVSLHLPSQCAPILESEPLLIRTHCSSPSFRPQSHVPLQSMCMARGGRRFTSRSAMRLALFLAQKPSAGGA